MLKISRETQRKSKRDGASEKEGYMSHLKRDMGMMLTGLALGAVLTGGAVAAGITAEPAWSPIYVDGRQVQMTAYNIAGNNYVKLRDIGRAVGFNVYYQNGVQVDSGAAYTGEAPAKDAPQGEPLQAIQVSSYKGNALKAGDRSMLVVNSDEAYSVSSSDLSVADVEKVSGYWVIVAKGPGTAAITVTAQSGKSGSLTLEVKPAEAIDLSANMEIRQEMIRLINQVRREHGVGELTVNEALMNAAQDCSTQMFRKHHNEYECRAAMAYGYPHGFGGNLTWFSGFDDMEGIAKTAVTNWVNSSGHFQTMIAERYDTIGVGVAVKNQEVCCYMFAGNPNSQHLYG